MTSTDDTPMCERIAADAAGLMALPADAPERREAEAHAREHAACAQALAEAARLFEALDAAPPPPPPSEEALARAAAPILADLGGGSRRDRGTIARLAVAVGSAAVASWALPLALARRPLTGGQTWWGSVALAAIAALTAATTVASGGVLAGAFPIASACAAIVAGVGGSSDALAPGSGVHCALLELATAAAAVVLGWGLARLLRAPVRGTGLLVAAAGGGALAGQAALHETCSASTSLPHLLVFHTGAVLIALVLALLAAARVARPASRP
jgi:hypothetical protein